LSERNSLVERVAELASAREVCVVTAESLTSGLIASTLGAGPDASEWFAGGIVAYQETVKFEVLEVPEGPVVTAECAAQMATAARRLLKADVAVSATGVGGPDPSEGEPAGTVFVSVVAPHDSRTRRLRLSGDPEEVLSQTVDATLTLLVEVLERD
jgi:nicotinamide-nucleotide amidase